MVSMVCLSCMISGQLLVLRSQTEAGTGQSHISAETRGDRRRQENECEYEQEPDQEQEQAATCCPRQDAVTLLARQIDGLRGAGVASRGGVSVSALRNNGTEICPADHLFTSN